MPFMFNAGLGNINLFVFLYSMGHMIPTLRSGQVKMLFRCCINPYNNDFNQDVPW